MQTLTTAVRHYLHDVLGIPMSDARPWERVNELPYFLQDAFAFSTVALLGQPVLLALARADRQQSLSEVRAWLHRVGTLAGQPVVYVTPTLASYERRRLIAEKVPFIVPGNQLYVPDIGPDLREYFRQRAPTVAAALSPAAQAMLITALLRQPWSVEWPVSTAALALGYTSMTLSRVVKELVAAELASVYSVGRLRCLRLESEPQQTWERAKPWLRSPVKQTVWVSAPQAAAGRLAGLSALAHFSMLTEPTWPVYALGAAEWKVATDAGVQLLPEPVAGAQAWQLWRYSPALWPGASTVDPLSLALSLQDGLDERIQQALDGLQAQFPW